MSVGRVLSAVATAGAVCGCAVLALSMARAAPEEQHGVADRAPIANYSPTRSGPVYRVVTPGPPSSAAPGTTAASTSHAKPAASSGSALSSSASSPGHSSRSNTTTSSAASSSGTSTHPKPAPTHHSAPPTSTSKPPPAPRPTGTSLPLHGFYTGSATKVITVVASSYSSTTATLKAWVKAPGGGWLRAGPTIYAHVGSQGLTTSPSESKSATPIGSFSLTQAFGAYSDPGTALPYDKTDSGDWWISQSGSLYNTHQHCWSGCGFTQGSPNEHLYYETPYYNYAVVIDYNRFPVHQGAGSAFFLHVTDGRATAGCVAIPQSELVSIMRWLSPSAHPRILIGVA
jgi:L,D-peptidoglycan transpeptidase YkuD (ErfK/YbiS/YcfS/YnhG family)